MYWRQHWQVLKNRHVFGLYWHISLFHTYQIPIQYCQYMPIHVLACIAIHTNSFPLYLASIVVCIVACIQSVFEHIIVQYILNSNTIYRLACMEYIPWDLLVLNTCWYVFNTYHQYTPQHIPQYTPIHQTHIDMY